ncbi:NAD(P)/FAD-dependent oxidoreductase [Actinokineospora sp.]|uniref:NAD(P)/FAD-dependent oxidoreductase n=1 Tax=Actinokineospora sp. TaxID=1872133 RepID=UPI003D6C5972
MADLLIVGGGFAGVWAAMSATRVADAAGCELDILLVSTGPDLVIKPRLYEADPSRMRVPLDSVLRPLGVRRTMAEVTGMSVADQRVDLVRADGGIGQEPFGRLVLATGSGVRRPLVAGASLVHDVDTIESAEALDRHLSGLPDTYGPGRFTAVVVGSGFTGIEVACELVDRLRRVAQAPAEVRVCLIELADRLVPQLGDGPRPTISAALAELDVEVRLGVAVTAVGPDTVDLSDGSTIEARTVVWTAGIAAGPLTAKVGGRLDPVGRLHVDRYLRVPQAPTVFTAGDVARGRHR